MAYDLEEQERIDALKDWWDKWNKLIYAVVIAFFLGLIGTNLWRHYQNSQQGDAEVLFKSVEKTAQEVAASKEVKKLTEAANAMADKFPNTFQATDAQLMAAKAAFDANDLATAKVHLQWVADKGREAYKPLANIRLASVLLDDKKHDDAMKALDRVKDDGFAAMVADLRGDIFAVQGKKDDARAAYQLAVDKAGDRSPIKSLSQAKLDAFGGSTKPAESKDAKDGKDAKGTK